MTSPSPDKPVQIRMDSDIAKQAVKLGPEFNKMVTKRTLEKKLPMWTEYAQTNVDRLFKMCGRKHKDIRAFSVERLRPIFFMKTTLIVGYGNSFHETVDMIKDIPRDKVCIVATDRPLRKLVENGVIPDLVVNLDSGEQIRPFYKEVSLSLQEKMKMNAALAITTHPREVVWFQGKKYWYIPAITPWGNNLTQQIAEATRLPVLPTAGNVGTTALLLAKILGGNPIVLIGMDFGREFSDKDWDPLATKDRLASSKEFDVTLPNGRHFRTDPILYAYAHSTRRICYHYDINCVNLSGGILHGKFILTGYPSPQEGGSSRDRMAFFIKEMKEWTMPDNIVKARKDFAEGRLRVPLSVFMPQKNEKLGEAAYGLEMLEDEKAYGDDTRMTVSADNKVTHGGSP
jgi:uncharacterized Rossmann fold enzyme